MPAFRVDMGRPKIFNIGFHKTGTTSLTEFVREQGLNVLHDVQYSMAELGLGNQLQGAEGDGQVADFDVLIDEMRIMALVDRYDYFSDNPWPLLYRRLDRLYPGSLFILSRRKVDAWMGSLLKHAGGRNTLMRQMIYGYGNPHSHVARYRKIYLAHNRSVIRYFSGRDNFLLIDLEDDDLSISRSLQAFLGPGQASGVAVFQSLNRGKNS